MHRIFDRQQIHLFSDEEIMLEISRRLRLMRHNSMMSQGELAQKANVSTATIKRIESGDVKNITFMTILKLLRAGGMIAGVADLIEEMPLPEYKPDKRPYFTNLKNKNT